MLPRVTFKKICYLRGESMSKKDRFVFKSKESIRKKDKSIEDKVRNMDLELKMMKDNFKK